jgi:hypothetical protein
MDDYWHGIQILTIKLGHDHHQVKQLLEERDQLVGKAKGAMWLINSILTSSEEAVASNPMVHPIHTTENQAPVDTAASQATSDAAASRAAPVARVGAAKLTVGVATTAQEWSATRTMPAQGRQEEELQLSATSILSQVNDTNLEKIDTAEYLPLGSTTEEAYDPPHVSTDTQAISSLADHKHEDWPQLPASRVDWPQLPAASVKSAGEATTDSTTTQPMAEAITTVPAPRPK